MRAKIVSCVTWMMFVLLVRRFSPVSHRRVGDARRPRARRPHSLSEKKSFTLRTLPCPAVAFLLRARIAREKVALRVVEGRRNLHRDVDVMIARPGPCRNCTPFPRRRKI